MKCANAVSTELPDVVPEQGIEELPVVFETEVVGILGQDKLIGLILRSKDREHDYTVATDLVAGQLDLTAQGTIAVDGQSSKTNVPGVFAAGDVIGPNCRQAITAVPAGNPW